MKTGTLRLMLAAPLMVFAIIAFNAFTKAPKDLVNGGGIAGGHHFNFTAVENKNSTTGHFSWDGNTYSVLCVYRSGSSATIYLEGGMAVNLVDNKKDDQISAPFAYETMNCDAAGTSLDAINMISVSNGNLTVH
jgi:hypothetical protein